MPSVKRAKKSETRPKVVPEVIADVIAEIVPEVVAEVVSEEIVEEKGFILAGEKVALELYKSKATLNSRIFFETRLLDPKMPLSPRDVETRTSDNGGDCLKIRNSGIATWVRLGINLPAYDTHSPLATFRILARFRHIAPVDELLTVTLKLAQISPETGARVGLKYCTQAIVVPSDTLVELSTAYACISGSSTDLYSFLLDLHPSVEAEIYLIEADWLAAETKPSESPAKPRHMIVSNIRAAEATREQALAGTIFAGDPILTSSGHVEGWALAADGTSVAVAMAVVGQSGQTGSVQKTFEIVEDLYTGAGFSIDVNSLLANPIDTEIELVLSKGLSKVAKGLTLPAQTSDDVIVDATFDALSEEELNAELITNSLLDKWPAGLKVDAATRFQETAQGWLVDYRSGKPIKMAVSACEVSNVGANRGTTYGMRLHVEDIPADGYGRVIAILDERDLPPGPYFFNCGFRTPLDATWKKLVIPEIFLGKLTTYGEKRVLNKVRTIKKRVQVDHTVQLKNVLINIPRGVGAAGPDDQFCIVFDLVGQGDLVLFNAGLAKARKLPVIRDVKSGDFEDQNIAGQLKYLKLSPLWAPVPDVAPPVANAEEIQPVRGPALTPFVQIIIPVFNASADVDECVQSIIKHTSSPFEIILSDDSSNAFTIERLSLLAQRDPRVRVHLNDVNLGYTNNINQAIQQTVADCFVLLNSDTIVSPGWLDKMYAALNVSDDTAAVGALSNAASWQSVPQVKSGKEWAVNPLFDGVTVEAMARLIEDLSEQAYPEFPLLNGFCTMFRRRVLEEANFFADDAFPRGYGEENDLCLRAGDLGYKLRVADDCYVFHKKSRSFGAGQRKELSKKANVLLRKRHPHIAFDKLEAEMRDCIPINNLRRKLVEALQIELNSSPSPQTVAPE